MGVRGMCWLPTFVDEQDVCRLRDRVVMRLEAEALSGDLDAVKLITMELLANAFRHAGGRGVAVCIESSGEKPSLVVYDRGPGFDMPLPSGSAAALDSGRGLLLVRALAESFDVERRPQGGSRVRAVLPLILRDRAAAF